MNWPSFAAAAIACMCQPQPEASRTACICCAGVIASRAARHSAFASLSRSLRISSRVRIISGDVATRSYSAVSRGNGCGVGAKGLAEARRRQRRVPVVGGQHRRVAGACRIAVPEPLRGASRPVAPAILFAQRLGHRIDGLGRTRPVASPERGTHVPLVRALVEVARITLREERQRPRVAAP